MKINQKRIFKDGEGDNWFNRNKSVLLPRKDQIILSMQHLNIKPKDVLEIGCSNGYRLQYIYKYFNANCVGVEPSKLAIKEGKLQYPNVKFINGTADKLLFDDNSFDLVIIGFCLYLCDRKDLFKIAFEVDRILKKGGHVIINDFYTPFPYSNDYKYVEGVKSYKMDYSKMFTWNPSYVVKYLYCSQKQIDNYEAIIVIHKGEVENDMEINLSNM